MMISRDRADAKIETIDTSYPETAEVREEISEEQKIENQGRSEFFILRRRWSSFILRWISLLIAFNIVLAMLVGWRIGSFNFDNMQWFVSAVTAETFLQIVGLGYIAVKYLFSDGRGRVRIS